MKPLYQSLLLSIAVLALAVSAFAQVPSTNDTSDENRNTGMGTFALGGPNATALSGIFNTASGFAALLSNTGGGNNTASGSEALRFNTTGDNNTASGYRALEDNTTGDNNTASGSGALEANTTGNNNTASGFQSLLVNTTGLDNTASGFRALQANTTGNDNTASGFQSLFSNTTGGNNTASGIEALSDNTSGENNTASGAGALEANTTGTDNTASGGEALEANTTGNDNTASGVRALEVNTTGSKNIAVGFQAGIKLTTGSNNIDIGSVGVATENDTIRIGAAAQTATFIAGIFGTSVTGSAVVVNSNGKLGVTVSSERYKTAIEPMGSNSVKLSQLRPVTFHLKTDPKGALQYGLIAEEVAKVYPELVIRDSSGQIQGVHYDELAPMLLNEMQKRNSAQDERIAAQDAKISQLLVQLTVMSAALQKLQSKDAIVAQR